MKIDLYLGDCLEIMKTLPDNSIDAVITDPPYGTTKLGWDAIIDLQKMWVETQRLCKASAIWVLFGSQPFTTDLINSNRKMFRYEIIWRKSVASGFLDCKIKPLKSHENILIFSQVGLRGAGNIKQTTYNPQYRNGKPYVKHQRADRSNHYNQSRGDYINVNEGVRYPRSVIQFANGNNHSEHPTQKPVDLMEWLVKTYSNEGETILDFTMGSGTTGVACVKTGRNFIGIEIEPTYFEIANRRIAEAQMQPALEMAVI